MIRLKNVRDWMDLYIWTIQLFVKIEWQIRKVYNNIPKRWKNIVLFIIIFTAGILAGNTINLSE